MSEEIDKKIFVHYQMPLYKREKRIEICEESFIEIENFIKLLRSQGYKNKIIFILNHVWEMTTHDELNFLRKFFNKKFKKYNINFLLFYNFTEGNGTLPDNVVQYNFFQNKTVYISTARNQKTSTVWNSSKFKGLLLTGKPNRIQRVLPLKHLLDSNLLNNENMEWSFFYIKENKNDIKKILNFNEEQLQEFVSKVSRNPDNIVSVSDTKDFNYYGFPYDCNLYNSTSWSLISETSVSQGAHLISEKTYRAIINRHPFIFFAQSNSEKFLRECGYRTFEYCYPYQYDIIENVEDRIAAAIKNVIFLKENWKTLDFDRINADVEYNYKTLLEKMNKEQIDLIEKLKFVDGDLLCDLMNYTNEGFLQNNVKDIIEGKNHIIYYDWI